MSSSLTLSPSVKGPGLEVEAPMSTACARRGQTAAGRVPSGLASRRPAFMLQRERRDSIKSKCVPLNNDRTELEASSSQGTGVGSTSNNTSITGKETQQQQQGPGGGEVRERNVGRIPAGLCDSVGSVAKGCRAGFVIISLRRG